MQTSTTPHKASAICMVTAGGILQQGSRRAAHSRVQCTTIAPAAARGVQQGPSLKSCRYNHALCFAGDRMIVAGGIDVNGKSVKTVECLMIDSNNTATGGWAESWHRLSPLDVGRSQLSLSVDSSYRLYAVGGKLESGTVSPSIELYDQMLGRWRSLGHMRMPRRGAAVCCVAVPGALLQPAEDAVLNSCGEYNSSSSSGVWPELAPQAVDVLVVCGGKSDDRCGVIEKSTELLLLPLPLPQTGTQLRCGDAALGTATCTGTGGINTTGTDAWVVENKCTPTDISNGIGARPKSGGGRLGSPSVCDALNWYAVQVGVGRVSSQQTAVECKRMSIGRVNAAAISIGCFAVICGGSNGAVALSSVEVYDVLSDEWYVGPRMVHSRVQPVLYVYGNNLYATGGMDNTGTLVGSSEKWVMKSDGGQREGCIGGYWELCEGGALEDLCNVDEQSITAGSAAVAFELDWHCSLKVAANKARVKNERLAEMFRQALYTPAAPLGVRTPADYNPSPSENVQDENIAGLKSSSVSFGDRRAGIFKLSIREMRLRGAKSKI